MTNVERFLVKEGFKVWKKDEKRRIYFNEKSQKYLQEVTTNPKRFKNMSIYYNCETGKFNAQNCITAEDERVFEAFAAYIREAAEPAQEEVETVEEVIYKAEAIELEEVDLNELQIIEPLLPSDMETIKNVQLKRKLKKMAEAFENSGMLGEVKLYATGRKLKITNGDFEITYKIENHEIVKK